jgi:predicted lipid-binding transport protein (Tim44 family)
MVCLAHPWGLAESGTPPDVRSSPDRADRGMELAIGGRPRARACRARRSLVGMPTGRMLSTMMAWLLIGLIMFAGTLALGVVYLGWLDG